MKWPWHRDSIVPWLLIWTLVNTWQAFSTELLHDEAYYWVYSKSMAWGYFDHPPAVALLIWLGSWIPGELGVRLTTVLLSTGILAFLFRWVNPRNKALFFAFLSSIVLFHIGGFVIVPDIPLIACACAFIVLFERYRAEDSGVHALLLGVVCALLMYSKYHGALLILFAFLAHPKLLRRWSFWGLAVFAIILFLPHMYWQWTHDFITFRFHLFERGGRNFVWHLPLNYLYGQILVYGPLMGLLMIASVKHWKVRSPADRTHMFVIAGVFLFFLLNSFRGRVEANWTAIALPSLIYLSWKVIEQRANFVLWLKYIAIPSILIVIVVRLMFAYPIWPRAKFNEVHDWAQVARDLREVAGDRHVAFRNSYQQASKYWFYTGQPAVSLNAPDYRGNQFDLMMPLLDTTLSAPLVHFTSSFADTNVVRYGEGTYTAREVFHRKFYDQEFNALHGLSYHLDVPDQVSAGSQLVTDLTIGNRGLSEVTLRQDGKLELMVWMHEPGKKRSGFYIKCDFPGQVTLAPGGEVSFPLHISLPSKRGEFEFRVGFLWDWTGGNHSYLYKITLTE